jgi:hypothetical protein
MNLAVGTAIRIKTVFIMLLAGKKVIFILWFSETSNLYVLVPNLAQKSEFYFYAAESYNYIYFIMHLVS